MHEFFTSYYDRLQLLHREVSDNISGLSAEELDWRPIPVMNSLTILVVHLTGAERYWIGDVAGQDPSGRVRSDEFEAHGWNTAELQERLDQTRVHSYAVLQRLTLEDLAAPRHSWRDDETYSVAWALLHALEHTAVHVGHIHAGSEFLRADFA